MLASDFRVAHTRAQFGLAEVRVGVNFPVGPMEIARAALSTNTLRRLMLTGQPIGSGAAQAAGIVDVIDDDTYARALQEAAVLAQLPSTAYAAVKRQIRNGPIATIEHAMAEAATAQQSGWFTDETRAAMRAMLG